VNPKKVGLIAVSIFLLTLVFSGVGKSAPEETHNVYSLKYVGLIVDIWAPYQADPGETINITVKTESVVPQQSIYVKKINMTLYALTNATTEVAFAKITHLQNTSLTYHEAEYNITIPDNSSLGLTYGKISCDWDFMGAPQNIPTSGFVLTYIEDLAFEKLQEDYEALNATYHSTLEDYSQVESKFRGEVDSTRNLMYVFIATTVVAAITVVVLLIRKPKKVWV
jgi:hypothetical protein